MFNTNFHTLKVAMDVSMLRQSVHAQNIANAETPGYRRKYVVFEDLLRQASKLRLTTTHERHISSSQSLLQAKVEVDRQSFYRNDQSGVDVDYEVAQMVANGLRYEVLARLMSKNIEYYNTVLRGV
ncbi:MAG: Flagellar basal body rod protein FlgB [Thermotoga sp. 50_1627]|uniref:flagellar basal body rod protein FlgB n=1 Tax=Pseudothermotoga sp. TaxID=2033661 RepID=UPI00076DB0E9|nr:MAG: Flagellar basal body rod protein FlgB [Thermotoga sp. 50_64]KUK25234.1 MAG: Flagellar basal body rod protein FlgB [Thermotoga sp. 50_1627]MBC7116266.1 flagellar basal body rod protein FlgB [Pseudothermotoga sp.]MDK2923296.1 flagellar basal-body rod protein FlgB [Pseudothermotoga sp.]HBT38710.1 flagellar basal body rod protein FlgB [Pseudothermotoga sp.]